MLTYEYYENTKHKKFMRKLYHDAFPKAERFMLCVLILCAYVNYNVRFLCILRDGVPVGIKYTVDLKGAGDGITYLMYLAIAEDKRNNGIGAMSLKDTLRISRKCMLAIEKPFDEISARRKNFYMRNGLFETGSTCSECRVDYEYLCSIAGFEVTPEIDASVYDSMSDNCILRWIVNHNHAIF